MDLLLRDSSISVITKSTRKMNFPSLINTSSKMPSGWANVLSAICKVMDVGVSFPKLSLLATEKGINLMLASESHSAFPIPACLIL